MYNEREKLLHHRQLLSEKEAAADLELLKKLKPNHPRLAEFGFSPKRSAGDILLELLSVAHRDEIVKNRLQTHMPEQPETPEEPETPEPEPEQTETPEETETPEPEPEPETPEEPEENEKAAKSVTKSATKTASKKKAMSGSKKK